MNVAVFLGAQTPANQSYIEQVVDVAKIIGKKGHTLVFGGSGSGTMAVLAKAANDAGVRIIGVVPEIFKDLVDKNNDVIEYVPNMGIRKERMAALSADADIYIINRENLPWLLQQDKKNKQSYGYMRTSEMNFKEHYSVSSGAGITFGYEQDKTLSLASAS